MAASTKARSGTTEDIKFKLNIEGALNAGINVGVYWFSTVYTSDMAKYEAEKCINIVSPYKNKLSFPIFFDCKEYTIKLAQDNNINLSLNLVSNICKIFLSILKSNEYKYGIYTSKVVLKCYLSDSLRNSCDFWIAQYINNCNYWGNILYGNIFKVGKLMV